MKEEKLTIPSKISGAQFREFAAFDTLRHRKGWRRPAMFAAFFAGVAGLAFHRAGRMQGAALLGCVLLAVGFGLPAVYFGNFFRSVRRCAQSIDPDEAAYTLTLTDSEISVKKGKQSASYEWSRLHSACRLKHGICLYLDEAHALLLPDDRSGSAWRVIAAHLGERARVYHK